MGRGRRGTGCRSPPVPEEPEPPSLGRFAVLLRPQPPAAGLVVEVDAERPLEDVGLGRRVHADVEAHRVVLLRLEVEHGAGERVEPVREVLRLHEALLVDGVELQRVGERLGLVGAFRRRRSGAGSSAGRRRGCPPRAGAGAPRWRPGQRSRLAVTWASLCEVASRGSSECSFTRLRPYASYVVRSTTSAEWSESPARRTSCSVRRADRRQPVHEHVVEPPAAAVAARTSSSPRGGRSRGARGRRRPSRARRAACGRARARRRPSARRARRGGGRWSRGRR